ncbi:MAG: TonB-dependent receptor [Bacteroidales bacterium]|nr:TonB-dependent receptor [Bacteroidales bacterium]
MTRKILLTLTCFLAVAISAFAQNRVHGVIRSSDDGEPVAGAVITVQGTDLKGTVSDVDGSFTLNNVPSGAKLLVSFIGMKSQEVDAGADILISLEPDSKLLKEVVITAYGTSTKGTFTGSVSSMDSETIEKRQVSNVTNALAGTMAGVQVLSNNGQPGVGSTIRVRGVGSINADANPLYVVDGRPFDGDISSINAQDIESITVAKDAATTSLYGARGANGVVTITTKKGKAGHAVINIDARVGVNSRAVTNYDVLSSPFEYTELAYLAIYNQLISAGTSPATAAAMVNGVSYGGISSKYALNGGDYGYGYTIFTVPKGEYLVGANGKINPKATLGYSDGNFYYTPDDWTKETFADKIRQEYNVSATAGNDRYSFYASAGFLDDKGVISNSGFRRETARLKADYKVKNWLKIGGNIAYSSSFSQYPDEQTNTTSSVNAFYIANFVAPVYPVYVRDAEGNIMMNNGRKVYDYGDGKISPSKRTFMQIANPVGDLIWNKEEYCKDIFALSAFAELKPFKGFTLNANASMDIEFTRHNYLGNAYIGQSAEYGGTAYQSSARTRGLDFQLIANYEFAIKNIHKFDFTAGVDAYQLKVTNLSAQGQNLYDPQSYYISNAIDQKNGYGSASKYATLGIIARANYSFADKYLVSFGFREDASSRFAPKNRWGAFLNGSAAWVISSEGFMDSVNWVNLLKLKASFGQQGNDAIGNNYAYLDQYSLSGSNGFFSDGVLSFKGNPDLTWEKSISYNVGLDFSLFEDRLSGSIEYFGRQSNNMLYYKPTPLVSGYSSLPMNIGSMKNYGLELELKGDIIRTNNVVWSAFFNFTNINNKIISLSPDLPVEDGRHRMIDGTSILEEGYSMYRLYLVEWAGVDKATGAPLFYTTDKDGSRVTTTDYQVASEHKIATDNLMPKVYGGFGTSVSAYGFDLSISLSYQLGGKMFDSGYQRLMHSGYYYYMGQNWHIDIRKAWTPENTDTDIPRINGEDRYSNGTTTRFLTSSNYLSLNNITFGYSLPEKWISKIGLSKVRIYVTADNVALISARKGLDPRQSYVSSTTARYTPIRTVSGGLNITF